MNNNPKQSAEAAAKKAITYWLRQGMKEQTAKKLAKANVWTNPALQTFLQPYKEAWVQAYLESLE